MRPAQIPVTLGLIAASVVVYLVFKWDENLVLSKMWITIHDNSSLPEISNGELWRLVTPIFLHFSIFHIVFNMLWLYMLGGLIEIRQGKWLLLLLILLTGVVSNLVQYQFSGPYFGGMSGVVYALFGYVWIQGITNAEFGIRLQKQIVTLMLGWFVICWSGVLEALFDLSVANSAHTAGLIGGIAVALVVTILFGRWQWHY